MAKFFFHFFDGECRSDDNSGLELPGTEEAYLEAVAAARAMWPELLTARCDASRCAFLVDSENGAELFRLDFSELLDDCRPSAVNPARSNAVLIRRLEETHRRASTARSDLRASFDEVYKALGESTALLARISAFERRHLQRP